MTISTLFVIFALICFLFGAFPSERWATRINLIALGLAFYMAAHLTGGAVLH